MYGKAAFVTAVVVAACLSACDRGAKAPPPVTRSAGAPLDSVTMTLFTFARGIEEYPAFSPDGGTLAYCVLGADGHHQIVARPVGSGEETAITSDPADHIQPAYAPDGGRMVYVRGREDGDGGDIVARDLETGEETLVAARASSPAFSFDGRKLAFEAAWSGPSRIYVADGDGRHAEVVNADSSEAVSHTHPTWSRDGRRIAYRTERGARSDIEVVTLKSRAVTRLTDDASTDLDPAWDPAADVVYFSSDRGGSVNLWRVAVPAPGDEERARPEPVTAGDGRDLQATFTRDGARMALAVERRNADLWGIDVSQLTGDFDPEPYALESSAREDSRGVWSPDSKVIAFNSDRGGHMNIWIRAIVGAGERQVTDGPGGDFQPSWHPRQRQLVFYSARSGNEDIWNVDIQSGYLRQLTDAPSIERSAAYAPDGHHIAYLSDVTGRFEVWVMDWNGKNQRAVTDIGAAGNVFLWMDDNDRIVFSSPGPDGRLTQHVVTLSTGAVEPFPAVAGGTCMSASPDQTMILDAVDHATLWLSPVDGSGPPREVFRFEDGDGVDFPRWSPDGRLAVFDRLVPGGGDVWLLDGL